jgi:alpha-amylase/alpha-mannosidase (GH57 family)
MKPIHDQTVEELVLTASIFELRVVIAELEAGKRKEQLELIGVPAYESPMKLLPDALEFGCVYTDIENSLPIQKG